MRLPITLVAAAALSACAPVQDTTMSAASEARPLRQCFSVSQVRNFRQGGPGQVFLKVGGEDVYELTVAGGCTDLDFAYRLALIPDGFTGPRLCTGDYGRVLVPGSTSTTSVCRVRVNRILTDAEVAALPSSQRP